jgi:lambda family phage portal protein
MRRKKRNSAKARNAEPRQRLAQLAPTRLARRFDNRYDAAQTTDENRRHWAAADYLSADAANSLSVRTYLRSRARYEIANNSYAKGIVETLANDEIGTGPTLQVQTSSSNFNKMVERRWQAWATAINLPQKLRTLVKARVGDGEGFAQFVTNRRLPEDGPQLDLWLIECDQVTSPYMAMLENNKIDGVAFDQYGNPISYDVLTAHPGGTDIVTGYQARSVPAPYMLHLFRMDRPGQHRGIPEITPALGLFAQLRRLTEAILAAAETAADMAVLLKTAMNSNSEVDQVAPLSTIDFERRMMTALPYGWEAYQVDPKQPPPGYKEFKRELLNEIARCLNIPYNVAACNSAEYNYASGRLDHQVYYRALAVNRSLTEAAVLNRIFAMWFAEAVKVYRWGVEAQPAPAHQWFWQELEHVDPRLVAEAQQIALQCGFATIPEIYAKKGVDHETAQEAGAKALGISVDEYRALIRQKLYGVPGIASEQATTASSDPPLTGDDE